MIAAFNIFRELCMAKKRIKMKAFSDNIRYIGADDENIDLFEGQYPVPNGISYNSYLIIDQEIAIIDTVDIRRTDNWMQNLTSQLPENRKPDYLIIQHMEPDHSGSIRKMLECYPSTRIVCTAKAASMLNDYFEDIDFTGRVIIVADGETLSLGKTTLRFLTAPMVHWPEVMLTLDETDGVLFSADAFGSFAMSDSGVDEAWDSEARRYYCNIVGRFGASVRILMKKIQPLKFSIIAPLHGPVLTENLARFWGLYDKWSSYTPETEGTLVAYASIYGGTAAAARRIADTLKARPDAHEVVLIDLCRRDVSYAVSEAFRLSSMVLCSVTYDGGIFPSMHTFIHHLCSKKLANRRIALVENGSWAPQAARIMASELSGLPGTTIIAPTLTLHSRLHRPDNATIEAICAQLP